jgi:hypothetical protein
MINIFIVVKLYKSNYMIAIIERVTIDADGDPSMSEPVIPGAAGPGAALPDGVAWSVADMAGDFTFRFQGNSFAQARPWIVAAVGHFRIDRNGRLTGRQKGAILPLQGVNPSQRIFVQDLHGHMRLGSRGDAIGEARIEFDPEEEEGVGMTGTFYVVPVGSLDRFWLVSATQQWERDRELLQAPLEICSGEAVRFRAG